MIDEDRLAELIRAAGQAYEPPADGPATIKALAGEGTGLPAPPRRRAWLVAVPASAVALILAVTLIGLAGRHGPSANKALVGRSPVAGPGGQLFSPGSAGGAEGGVAPGAGYRTSSKVQEAPALAPPAGLAPAPTTPVGPAVPISGPRVVKTGSIDLEVRRGGFGATVDQLSTLVSVEHGFVADSKTTESDASPSGTLTLRVPAAAFDDLVKQVRALGRVRGLSTAGQDVTAQYTDLDARIHALSATRDQFLTLLGRANSIGDLLAVQDRLSQLQMQIEQLQGQQKVLDDQSSYATLTVNLAEPGQPTPGPPPPPRTGLANAWHQAVSGFVRGIEAILGASGTLLLVLLVLGVLIVAVRAIWGRTRRPLV